MVKPKCTANFPEAVVREGEEEGMLRTFLDTTSVGDSRWVPPLLDGDWHTISQAIYNGVDGALENLHCKYADSGQLSRVGHQQEGKGVVGTETRQSRQMAKPTTTEVQCASKRIHAPLFFSFG